MINTRKAVCACIVICFVCSLAGAQSANSKSPVVPQLVNFSGKAVDDQGKPLAGIAGITFSIYSAQQGGSPLWTESQNVQPDTKGNYTVQLGAATSEGLPLSLFTSGEARWLGVRVNGDEEQPRILLLSVPYALKAADAQTLNGLPASAFALAGPAGSTAQNAIASSPSGSSSANIGGSGTEDYIPLWTDNNGDLGNSILFQTGTGSSAKIGINITKPLFTLDVNGQELVRGLFEMATQNYASKTKGYDSQPLNFESSAFSSTTGTYTLNHFQWQAEPTGNNTTTPGATLNLLYGTDPASPAETGLQLSSKGLFTFATGQTFPGTGTITGVTTASGSGLSGGGGSGNLNLSLVNSCAANQVLQWNGSAWACSSAGSGTITGVTAGADLTGGGTSGNVTLNVDTTKVPQLATSNTFSGKNTFNGSITFNAPTTFQASNTTPIYATSSSSNSAVIEGIQNSTCCGSIGMYGTTVDSSGYGVEGYNQNSSETAIGIYGLTFNGYGVYGSGGYAGVYGNGGRNGVYGSSSGGYAVYANASDSNGDYGTAVAGYANQGPAAYFENDSDNGFSAVTLSAFNDAPAGDDSAYVLDVYGNGGACDVDKGGNLSCDGSKSAVVPVDGGLRKVALYAVEAPENWFEDYGSGQLSKGSARIDLEPTFAQTVNTDLDYHVFLTPRGECEGLYVTNLTPSGFEVRELHHGSSTVAFDYRIIAKRKNYEAIRLADFTERKKKLAEQRARMHQHRPATIPAASNPTAALGQKPGSAGAK